MSKTQIEIALERLRREYDRNQHNGRNTAPITRKIEALQAALVRIESDELAASIDPVKFKADRDAKAKRFADLFADLRKQIG